MHKFRFTAERSGATTWGLYDNRLKRFDGERTLTETQARQAASDAAGRECDRMMLNLIKRMR